jgi:hypothetical protein
MTETSTTDEATENRETLSVQEDITQTNIIKEE